MRKSLIVGILKEANRNEERAPLTPCDVRWLKKRFIDVEVESSKKRIFSDRQYKRAGAQLVNTCRRATLLLGIKGPSLQSLKQNKIYMVFSHTIKGQCNSIPLLDACIKKGVTLIDYEKIEDQQDKRLVYFGRFAGICGAIDALCCVGKKLKAQGIDTPFSLMKMARDYSSLESAKRDVRKVAQRIKRKGFNKRLTPFVVGITGHGNVSYGIQEILALLNPVEIHPKDMQQFIKSSKGLPKRVYQIIFGRGEKLRLRDGRNFYCEEYLENPKKYESNMDIYLPYLNMLLHASYWDARYPRLVTKAMVNTQWSQQCRLSFIADISCDVGGAIELTYKTTTADKPVYTYNPHTKKYTGGHRAQGITILARDNLPTELPQEASEEFSSLIREYVYQIAVHGVSDITRHMAIPQEIRRAVIVERGALTKAYRYLEKCL